MIACIALKLKTMFDAMLLMLLGPVGSAVWYPARLRREGFQDSLLLFL